MTIYLSKDWLILALAGLVILWVASLWAMRLWTRRQLLRTLLAQEAGAEIPLPAEPRPEDQAALEIIRTRREGYLWNRWPQTTFSFNGINEMTQELIREIAGVYYPEEERPELKASLADLLAMHNRVGMPAGRLAGDRAHSPL